MCTIVQSVYIHIDITFREFLQSFSVRFVYFQIPHIPNRKKGSLRFSTWPWPLQAVEAPVFVARDAGDTANKDETVKFMSFGEAAKLPKSSWLGTAPGLRSFFLSFLSFFLHFFLSRLPRSVVCGRICSQFLVGIGILPTVVHPHPCFHIKLPLPQVTSRVGRTLAGRPCKKLYHKISLVNGDLVKTKWNHRAISLQPTF